MARKVSIGSMAGGFVYLIGVILTFFIVNLSHLSRTIIAGCMGKFRRNPQANRRREQELYSILRKSNWFRDMVHTAKRESYSCSPKWKMAIVSLFAAYCISTLSNYVLSP